MSPLSLSGLHLFTFFKILCFVCYFTSQNLWKNSLHCMFYCLHTVHSPPHPPTAATHPPPTFASAHSPTIPVCFVYMIKVSVFAFTLAQETTRRAPPAGRSQKRAPLASVSTPLSLTDSLKQVALLPSSPPPLPSSAWLPSAAINHPKLINTNKAAS